MAGYRSTIRLALAICIGIATAWTAANVSAAESASFLRDVKPILARRCFSCHGPSKQEGGLRIDDPDRAVGELDSGDHAIVPSHVDKSVLIERVTATDDSERMPPTGKPLTKSEIQTLKQWIASGAIYEKHWAFVPPRRQPAPEVKEKQWVQNPIDTFILARLEAANLEPALPVDKWALARRAYF